MGSLLLVSVLIVTVGLAATTRTENVTVGGYYPGIIVSALSGRPGPGRAGWCVGLRVEPMPAHRAGAEGREASIGACGRQGYSPHIPIPRT